MFLSPPILAPRRLATILLSVFAIAFASGCSSNFLRVEHYDVPTLASVKEQSKFADELAARYFSPLKRKEREESNKMAGKALAAYSKVLEVYPQEKFYVGRSRLGIANILYAEGRKREALADYEALIEEYPEDERLQAIALEGAARIADGRGDIEKAKGYYQRILERWANSKDNFYKTIAMRARNAYVRVRER